MSGSEKNNRGENDSIKEMLERLRRSVTDLPPEEPEVAERPDQPEDPIEEVIEEAVEEAPAPTPETENGPEEPQEVDKAISAPASDTLPEAEEKMILVPWEDEPLSEEEPFDEDEELFDEEEDALPEDVATPEAEAPCEDELAPGEDFFGDEEVDEETIAAFFTAEEAEGEEEAPVETVNGEEDAEDEAVLFAEEEEPLLALEEDELPEDFVDIVDAVDDEDEPAATVIGTPVITDDEAARLFRAVQREPEAPASPAADAPASRAREVEANEDNGYAVEVEVIRRPAPVPLVEEKPTEEAPMEAPSDEPSEPTEPDEPKNTATHGLSNGETRWRDNSIRRRPVEVLEDSDVDEPAVADFREFLGKGKSAEKEVAEMAVPTSEKQEDRVKREKKSAKPYGPGVQLSIDDIKEDRAAENEDKKSLLAWLFSKNSKKAQAEEVASDTPGAEEPQSFDIQQEKDLRRIQNHASRAKGGRAASAVSGLYDEEAAAYNEYTSRNQKNLFQQKFESELSLLALRIAILSFLSVMLLVLENGIHWGLPLERLFVWPISLTGMHLLLLFFALLCCIPVFAAAWRQLFARRLVSEFFVAASLVSAVLYDAILCFSLIPTPGAPAAVSLSEIHLFGLLPVAAVLVLTVVDFQKVKSDLAAFHLISSAGDKLACAVSNGGTTKAETDAIADLNEGASARVVSVKKVGFTTGFFHRVSRNCEDEMKNLWLLPTAGVAALLVAIIAGILGGGPLGAVYTFCVTVSLALPACALILHKVPVCELFRFASANSCAVVGEVSAIEYSDADAFAFEDVEAFPARNVRVQRIKLYNESALDHVMYQVAGVFSAVGGPLDGVFRSSTSELGLSSDVRLLQAAEGGLIVAVDGRQMCVGNGDFMLKKQVRMYFDAEDEQILANGKTCIMYVAEEGQLIAKFYIRYRMNEEFERDVERLAANKIRVLVRTYDPNIREALIDKISYTSRYGVRVVRKTVEQQTDYATPQLNSGIVSHRSVREILRVLLACRRACRLTSFSEAGGLVIGCVGMLVSIILAVFGALLSTPSLVLLLYQLFWTVPVLLASKFYITRK